MTERCASEYDDWCNVDDRFVDEFAGRGCGTGHGPTLRGAPTPEWAMIEHASDRVFSGDVARLYDEMMVHL